MTEKVHLVLIEGVTSTTVSSLFSASTTLLVAQMAAFGGVNVNVILHMHAN